MTAAVWTLIAMQGATILGLFVMVGNLRDDHAKIGERLTAIEARLDSIERRLDDHERRITSIEQPAGT